MNDLISRGDAIKAVLVSNLSACTVFGRSEEGMATAKELIQVIKNLPSAQPDRKTSEWLHNLLQDAIDAGIITETQASRLMDRIAEGNT